LRLGDFEGEAGLHRPPLPVGCGKNMDIRAALPSALSRHRQWVDSASEHGRKRS
jgi:hypothetical protein